MTPNLTVLITLHTGQLINYTGNWVHMQCTGLRTHAHVTPALYTDVLLLRRIRFLNNWSRFVTWVRSGSHPCSKSTGLGAEAHPLSSWTDFRKMSLFLISSQYCTKEVYLNKRYTANLPCGVPAAAFVYQYGFARRLWINMFTLNVVFSEWESERI